MSTGKSKRDVGNRIIFRMKDGTRRGFADLTGLANPKGKLQLLHVYARAAMNVDSLITGYDIVNIRRPA